MSKEINDKSNQLPKIKYIGKQSGDLGIGDKLPTDKSNLDIELENIPKTIIEIKEN